VPDADSPRPQGPAEQVVIAWSSARNNHDADALARLYAPRVRFYGKPMTAIEVVKLKRAALGKQQTTGSASSTCTLRRATRALPRRTDAAHSRAA
jgi:ketosteroid isomerase-like protein